MTRLFIWAALLLMSVVAFAAQAGVTGPQASYVGGQNCTGCHAEQARLWQGSHHDLAMQVANKDTVLGNFNDSEFLHFGVTSRFYKNGDRFMVRTDDADGKLQDFEIKYTFGVTPLQQYLVEFPGGRLQAFGIAWDSRSIASGGQRWFHLYPDEKIDDGDELHWTGLSQNWNHMCATCHSTNLQKNYDASSKQFATSWAEIDVACEACHGPGSAHLQWVQQRAAANSSSANGLVEENFGLEVVLDERKNVTWHFDTGSRHAVRSEPNQSPSEIDVCARCHSHRGALTKEAVPGQSFMDTHRPSLLTEGLYFADGQIQDEVYVYGSFVQSKMFHEGVSCSDCHEPHSLKLQAPAEQVCLQCHATDHFATVEHHFHPPDSDGAQCVACHMPETSYMVVDPRRDHSIRIPRPELAAQAGAPDACTQCHTDKSSDWAVVALREWYPDPTAGFQQYIKAFVAARSGAPEAGGYLLEVLDLPQQPAIGRATALAELAAYPVPQALQVIGESLNDDDPVVRLGGLLALASAQAPVQLELAEPLLRDPVRSVRLEAGRLLASLPDALVNQTQRALINSAANEAIEALRVDADRPEVQVNLGNLYARMGNVQEAAAAYEEALLLDRRFAAAWLNLADLYRRTDRDDEAKKVLMQGLQIVPEDPTLLHASGLAMVRDKRLPAAIELLRKASELAPQQARYAWVYAIGLDANGQSDKAIDVLERALKIHQYHPDILSALVDFARKTGMTQKARHYQGRLGELQQRAANALVDR